MRNIFDLSVGESAKILGFENGKIADIFGSMGLCTGQNICLISKSGTVVIGLNFRTIAIGRSLAGRIYV
ncbi:MAG: ferrous iron transport protein A [Puniceicoccales bacterium]|nr:ferrous iron transport protein A [Puniceicoccales bacterium]